MISRDIAAAFERDGVYLARGLFDRSTLAPLEEDFDRVVEQLVASNEAIDATWATAPTSADHAQVVLHTHGVESYSARWLHALMDPRFVDAAAAILGPDVVLHHTKLFQKPRGAGSPFPMHQDWKYFPVEDDRIIAAIIHVSPATTEMGCVRAYPGSHRLGRLDSSSGDPAFDDPDGYRRFSERFPIGDATAYEAEPGDVLFFSSLTVHGSGPNVSDDTRKTVLAQLYAGSARYDGGDHPLSGLVLRGWNRNTTRDRIDPDAARRRSQKHRESAAQQR